MSVDVLLLIGVLILMAFGTFAAVLPVVPGPALVWFGAMIYAIATGFQQIGAAPLILLTLLMILGSTTNLWMAAFGVKATGGSAWGIAGGMIGLLIGMILLFPIGALIGVAVGTVGVELLRTRDWRKALHIGGGTVGGFLLGVLAEFAVAGIMDIVFLISLAVSHRAV
jgi:uncharacterized protein YqgC (DUF456 family)